MRIVPQLIAALQADPQVQAAVGSQIYADYPPQGVDPTFLVLSVPSGQAFGTLSNCQVRVYSARVTVDIVCDTRASTEIGIEAVEDLLDGFTSSDPDFPISGTTLDGGISWDVLTPKDGSDERAFICSQEYQVHYKRNL